MRPPATCQVARGLGLCRQHDEVTASIGGVTNNNLTAAPSLVAKWTACGRAASAVCDPFKERGCACNGLRLLSAPQCADRGARNRGRGRSRCNGGMAHFRTVRPSHGRACGWSPKSWMALGRRADPCAMQRHTSSASPRVAPKQPTSSTPGSRCSGLSRAGDADGTAGVMRSRSRRGAARSSTPRRWPALCERRGGLPARARWRRSPR